MGKRGANCMSNPSLIEYKRLTSCHRRMSESSCSSAAMTLLALKQESPTARSSATSGVRHGTYLQSNLATPHGGHRSPSMCSSVTDDDGSTMGDESTSCFGDTCSIESPRSGHALIRMALVRPKFRLVSFHSNVSPTLSIPSWKVPPEGRPLPPPGRLPRSVVIVSESSLMTKSNWSRISIIHNCVTFHLPYWTTSMRRN